MLTKSSISKKKKKKQLLLVGTWEVVKISMFMQLENVYTNGKHSDNLHINWDITLILFQIVKLEEICLTSSTKKK